MIYNINDILVVFAVFVELLIKYTKFHPDSDTSTKQLISYYRENKNCHTYCHARDPLPN